MGKKSAGIILFRKQNSRLEIMLVHPGGPFWAKKDDGAWSIPKGEFEEGENPLAAAKREFEEETGQKVAAKNFIELSPVKNKSGKQVFAFAAREDFDATNITSNLIWVDWPPRSGKRMEVPEVDRAEWFDLETSRQKILSYLLPLIDELAERISDV